MNCSNFTAIYQVIEYATKYALKKIGLHTTANHVKDRKNQALINIDLSNVQKEIVNVSSPNGNYINPLIIPMF